MWSRDRLTSAMLAIAVVTSNTSAAQSADENLIPRGVLFQSSYSGDIKSPAQVSPDGKWVAFVRSGANGVDNIWVARRSDPHRRRQITNASAHGVRRFEWAVDGEHILYFSDDNGHEDFHLYAAGLSTDDVRDLTPFPGARCAGIQQSWKRPGTVLAFVNARDPRVFDVYRVNLANGVAVIETANPGDVMRFTADEDLTVRAASAFRVSDGATVVRVRDNDHANWRDLLEMPFEKSPFFGQVNGATVIVGFSANGQRIYVANAMRSDTIRLSEFDVTTGAEVRVVAQDPRGSMLVASMERYVALQDPRSKQVLAVPFEFDIPTWSIVDPSVAGSFAFLRRFHPGVLSIDSQDLDNRYWTITYRTDRAPPAAYLFDRKSHRIHALDNTGPPLASYRFSPMQALEVPARDGMSLLVYLTVPGYGQSRHLPAVIFIHGGPWYRDEWGFSPVVQLLANRGYAVIQVQYRGSDGLGMRYLNAGTHEMGLGTDDDIDDVVSWMISHEIIDPGRVAAMGYSFGGYHVLRALTRHPDRYAAGVVIAGNSDLATSLQTIPDYWQPVIQRHIRRLGDVLGDPDLNRRLSPLQNVSSLRSPLLVAAGLHDARNNVAESQQIVDAARRRGIPVAFIVYPDEGHFITRAPNEQDLYGRIEEFLYSYLHGRREPYAAVPAATGEMR